MARRIVPPKERFMQRVHQEPMSGCWLWEAGCDKKGYGRFRVNLRQVIATRFSYAMFVGEIPAGLLVLHRCDNPPCVNPDHLYLGTFADNSSDMAKRGRGSKSKSGHPYGVKEHGEPRTNPFSARVRFRGKDYNFGSFPTPALAHAVAMEAKRVLYSPGSVDEARQAVAEFIRPEDLIDG